MTKKFNGFGPYGVLLGVASGLKSLVSVTAITQFIYRESHEGKTYLPADSFHFQDLPVQIALLLFLSISIPFFSYCVARVESVYIDKKETGGSDGALLGDSGEPPQHCIQNKNIIVAGFLALQFTTHFAAAVTEVNNYWGATFGLLLGIIVCPSFYGSSGLTFKKDGVDSGALVSADEEKHGAKNVFNNLVGYADPIINGFAKAAGVFAVIGLIAVASGTEILSFNPKAFLEYSSGAKAAVLVGSVLGAFAFWTEFKMRHGYDIQKKLKKNFGYEDKKFAQYFCISPVINVCQKNWMQYYTVFSNALTFASLGYKICGAISDYKNPYLNVSLALVGLVGGGYVGWLEGQKKLSAILDSTEGYFAINRGG